MPELIPMLLQAALAGAISGVAFWAAIRVEIKYMRRDIDTVMMAQRSHVKEYHPHE